MKNTYITTTLPYVNADPHIGFALEIVQADIFARYRKLMGDEVFFNTGTDEHGVKIYRNAQEQGVDTQKYVDGYAMKFRNLQQTLGLLPDIHFIRTTDPQHVRAAQEFWKRCFAAGDIYKKNYKIKYCVGCELEKTDSELVDGKCPLHPNLPIEIIDEENYFFKFSRFQKPLLELYKKQPDFVVPDFRFNEIRAFVERGLEDFSISRLKTKMPWGVEVPGDPDHIMYVWFDALVSYISTIGWPESQQSGKGKNNAVGDFEKWWGTAQASNAIQFAGKDNLRQQSAMWQAMLMSAGLPASKQIVIHGFINSGGQKMSKSLGNVIDPYAIVAEYSTDALRYYLAREVHPFEDSDFTLAKFKDAYNANLANGIGNLFSRVMKMALSNNIVLSKHDMPTELKETDTIYKAYKGFIENYKLNQAMDQIWLAIGWADKSIQQNEPFKTIKTDPEKGKSQISLLLEDLLNISLMLKPIMPETAEKIWDCVINNKMPEKLLFMRKD